MLDQLRAVRQITDRNVRDVKETRSSSAEIIKHAEELSGIAQENARLLGGRIEVWSEPGEGTRFTLRL